MIMIPRLIHNPISYAGGNGEGSGLNQFNGPTYIQHDSDDNLYILDRNNLRVVKWEPNLAKGLL